MTLKIGVILLDSCELSEYNEHISYSFRNFAQNLIMIGILPKVILRDKRRTILMDRNDIFVTKPYPTPDLIDAWLRFHPGPAKFVVTRKKNLDVILALQKAHYLLKRNSSGQDWPDFYQF